MAKTNDEVKNFIKSCDNKYSSDDQFYNALKNYWINNNLTREQEMMLDKAKENRQRGIVNKSHKDNTNILEQEKLVEQIILDKRLSELNKEFERFRIQKALSVSDTRGSGTINGNQISYQYNPNQETLYVVLNSKNYQIDLPKKGATKDSIRQMVMDLINKVGFEARKSAVAKAKYKVGDKVKFETLSGNVLVSTIISMGSKDGETVYDFENGKWCYEEDIKGKA